jgi:hypothetical protein
VGYKREKKIFRLQFEDPSMAGLEVRAKSTSMGEYLTISRLLTRLQANPGLVESDVDTLEELFARFARVLVSWNLEDEDEDGRDVAIPPTKEGLLGQDPDFAMGVVNAWASAVGGVDEELGKDSNSGPRFPEVNIPMAALSTSPGS